MIVRTYEAHFGAPKQRKLIESPIFTVESSPPSFPLNVAVLLFKLTTRVDFSSQLLQNYLKHSLRASNYAHEKLEEFVEGKESIKGHSVYKRDPVYGHTLMSKRICVS